MYQRNMEVFCNIYPSICGFTGIEGGASDPTAQIAPVGLWRNLGYQPGRELGRFRTSAPATVVVH